MNDDGSFDFSSDEYNYIDNDIEYESDDDELENFIINEIYNTSLVKEYEDALYEELDVKNDKLCSNMYKVQCLLNIKERNNKKIEIIKKFYTVIKNGINKFNNIKNISNNNYVIIPIIHKYIHYSGINCYITNNINEIENTVNKIINLFETIEIYVDNYNLKEINELNIKEGIMNKNKKLEINTNNLKDDLKDDLKVFILDINFIN
tara:strand:- start:904 stop:1521 length:618 start_codon:yes stop_codon:yes gene_type:complete